MDIDVVALENAASEVMTVKMENLETSATSKDLREFKAKIGNSDLCVEMIVRAVATACASDSVDELKLRMGTLVVLGAFVGYKAAQAHAEGRLLEEMIK